MHYYINVNQRVLTLIGRNEIDLIDGAILNCIAKMCKGSSIKLKRLKIKGLTYTWVSYSHLCDELPLIKIHSTSPIQKRINKLISFGFLAKETIDKTKSYITALDKTELLKRSTIPAQYQKRCFGCMEKCEGCDIYKSIIGSDDSLDKERKSDESYEEDVEEQDVQEYEEESEDNAESEKESEDSEDDEEDEDDEEGWQD